MAIGFLECAGYGAVLYAMDRACKAADIEIIGIDTINPKDASAFIPLTAQVKVACEVARRAALKLNRPEDVLVEVIERPYDGTKALSCISKVKFQEEAE